MKITQLFAPMLLGIVVVGGVKHGDEKFAEISATDGAFYAFCNGPEDGTPSIDVVAKNEEGEWKIVRSIQVDQETGWADPVYLESCKTEGKGYLMAADRNLDQVYAVDPYNFEVKQKVKMGDRPVHAYAVADTGEYWAHSDGQGHFDVINIDEAVDQLFKAEVQAKIATAAHGKLLFDKALDPYGYASTTGEDYVIQINMKTHEMTNDHFNFTSYNASHPYHCPGTHGLAYSTVNGHIYATCGNVGLIELMFHEGRQSFDIISLHKGDTGGQVYTSPDESHIVTFDKTNGEVHLLKPGASGAISSKEYPSVIARGLGDVDAGGPDKPAFIKNEDGSWRLFVSLTAPNVGDDESGLGWIDLKTIEENPKTQQTLNFVRAGRVDKGGFRTYRSIVAGGGHVATVMALPSAGLAIVDAATLDVKYVKTNEGVSRVLWVPTCYQGLYCNKPKKTCPMIEMLPTEVSTTPTEVSTTPTGDKLPTETDGSAQMFSTILFPVAVIFACAFTQW